MLHLTDDEAKGLFDCVNEVIRVGGLRTAEAIDVVMSARRKLLNLPGIKKAIAEKEKQARAPEKKL